MDGASILNSQAKKIITSKMALILCVLLSFYSAFSLAAQNQPEAERNVKSKPWKIWRESQQLKVSYRPSEHKSLIEIKAEAKLTSTLSGFIYFIEDLAQMPNWLDNAKSAEILEQFTVSENIFITRFNGLWPVSAREMIVHSRYWQNDDLSLEIAVIDASDFIPKNRKAVRMQVHSAHWKIIPTAAKQIEISYQFIVDPKGNIPQWLTKPMTLNGIWTTLNNLQEQLPSSDWQQQQKSHIKEWH